MSAGKIIGYVVAAILVLFGVLFILATFSEGSKVEWFFIGLVLVGIGLGIIALVKFREPKPTAPPQEIIQKIDLSGDVALETMTCRKCGGQLEKDSISLQEGAIFISCPYCGASYQLVEEPKW